jgi:hypothetical protein
MYRQPRVRRVQMVRLSCIRVDIRVHILEWVSPSRWDVRLPGDKVFPLQWLPQRY